MVDARSRRKTGTHFSGSRFYNLELDGGASPQKGSPAKRTGHTLRVAPQYIQKTPKNNGLFGIWLADLGVWPALIALFRVGIDPPQHFLEMGFDRLVAQAGPQPQGVGVAD